MKASHEEIKKQHEKMSNSKKQELTDLAYKYASCDEKSQELNDERKHIREQVKALGEDPKAFQDQLKAAKRALLEKDKYYESADRLKTEVFDDMNMDDLFEHVLKREQEKEEAKKQRLEEAKKKKENKVVSLH
jgi:chromosome segregation ATPase